MGHYDNPCFSAELVQLAVKGHVIIRREKEGRRDQWTVEEPEKASDQPLLRHEKALVKNLFSFLSLIKLTKENGVYFIVAKRAHFRALARDLKSRNYSSSTGTEPRLVPSSYLLILCSAWFFLP